MRAEPVTPLPARRYRLVFLTLDAHAAGPLARATERLARDFPGLETSVHAAAEWSERPDSLARATGPAAWLSSVTMTTR